MKKSHCVAICFSFFIFSGVASSSDIPPFKIISWEERIYKASLPRFFENLIVHIKLNKDAGIEEMTIRIDRSLMKIDAKYLEDVENPGDLEIAIYQGEEKGGERGVISITFEYGVPLRRSVEIYKNHGEMLSEWIRKVMVIRIDKDNSVSVKKLHPDQNQRL